MARAQGARAQLLGAFESAYGTPPASDYIKFPFVSSALGTERPLTPDDLLGLGRDPSDPTPDVTTGGGDLVVPVDLRHMGHWLRLLLGDPVTTGSAGAYTHTYTSGGWTLPSMACEIGFPEVPHFPMVGGVMANSLALSMSESGNANATLNLIARNEVPATVSVDETPSEMDLDRFVQFQGAIKQGGSALADIVSGDLTYSNNLDPVRNVGSGGLISGADPAKASCTGNLQARFSSTALLTLATANTPVELEYSYTISATKKLVVTVHRVFLPKPKVSVTGPAGVQVPFAWQAARALTGAERMCTVALLNDVADYTP